MQCNRLSGPSGASHRTSQLSRPLSLLRSPRLGAPSRITTRSTDTSSIPSPSPSVAPEKVDAQPAWTDAEAPVKPNPSPTPASREPTPSPEPHEDEDESPGVASHPLNMEADEVEEDYFASQELIKELQEGFGNRGEVWFLAQLVGLLLIVFCPFQLTGLIDMLGTLALTAGGVFLIYALVSLGRNLSPLPIPRKKHTLVVSGMYAYVRHPMYGGLLLVALGLACLTRSETRLAMGTLLWWILEQKVAMEERGLMELYPGQYAQYKETVKKFLPFLY